MSKGHSQIREILFRLVGDERFRFEFERDRESALKRYRLSEAHLTALRVLNLASLTGVLAGIAARAMPGHF